MVGRRPPATIKPGDELTVAWLNDVRKAAVEGSIAKLGAGLRGMPTPNGWSIGLAGNELVPGVFFCLSSSGSWGATGAWPSLTPGSITGVDIYQAQGLGLTKIATSQTVYNWFPSSPVNSKVLMVFPDGTGNWIAGPQSCT